MRLRWTSARMTIADRRRTAGSARGVTAVPHLLDYHRPWRKWPGQRVYGDPDGNDMLDVSPTRRGVGSHVDSAGNVYQLNYATQWFDHAFWWGCAAAWHNATSKTNPWREQYPLPDDNEYWNVSLLEWADYGSAAHGNCTWDFSSSPWWRTLR